MLGVGATARIVHSGAAARHEVCYDAAALAPFTVGPVRWTSPSRRTARASAIPLTTTVGTAHKRAACARCSESPAHASILDDAGRGHPVRREQTQRHSIQLPGERDSASASGAIRLA